MKKILAVVLFAIALGATFTSCTSAREGCKATQGMIGYK